MSGCARSAHRFGRRLLRSSSSGVASSSSILSLSAQSAVRLSSSRHILTLNTSASKMAPIQSLTRAPVARTSTTSSSTSAALSTSLLSAASSSASSSTTVAATTKPIVTTTADHDHVIPSSSLVHPVSSTAHECCSCTDRAKSIDPYLSIDSLPVQSSIRASQTVNSKCTEQTSKSIQSNELTHLIDLNESVGESSTQTPLPNLNLKRIYRNNLFNRSVRNTDSEMRAPPFKPRKALILTKFSRLEYEQRRMPDCSESQVKDSVRPLLIFLTSFF
jgi:hypothetical protein